MSWPIIIGAYLFWVTVYWLLHDREWFAVVLGSGIYVAIVAFTYVIARL